MKNSKIESFTLVELLIVLALISILATVLIVIIKPGIIFSKARDTKRIADIKNIEKTIDSLSTEQNFYELNYASPNIVYLSLQDTSSTCGSYLSQLPSLPSGWSYHCSATPTNIDGTGWIPIPFSNFPIINISQLFIDPLNKPPYYYSFVVGGSYAVYGQLEDSKNQASKNDNDNYPYLFSAGTDKRLIDQAQGLVGYWTFDEGSGTTAYDYSGNNNNGTLINGPTWTTGKVGGALSFDGVDDYVNIGKSSVGPPCSVEAWIYKRSNTSFKVLLDDAKYSIRVEQYNSTYKLGFTKYGVADYVFNYILPLNTWQHVVWVFESTGAKLYVNGTFVDSNPNTISCPMNIMGYSRSSPLNSIIDEVRIYNRALSDAEISALYNATK